MRQNTRPLCVYVRKRTIHLKDDNIAAGSNESGFDNHLAQQKKKKKIDTRVKRKTRSPCGYNTKHNFFRSPWATQQYKKIITCVSPRRQRLGTFWTQEYSRCRRDPKDEENEREMKIFQFIFQQRQSPRAHASARAWHFAGLGGLPWHFHPGLKSRNSVSEKMKKKIKKS